MRTSSATARGVRPSPQTLSRGNSDFSRSSTSRPAEAQWNAAADPAGPAPTTMTSASSCVASTTSDPTCDVVHVLLSASVTSATWAVCEGTPYLAAAGAGRGVITRYDRATDPPGEGGRRPLFTRAAQPDSRPRGSASAESVLGAARPAAGDEEQEPDERPQPNDDARAPARRPRRCAPGRADARPARRVRAAAGVGAGGRRGARASSARSRRADARLHEDDRVEHGRHASSAGRLSTTRRRSRRAGCRARSRARDRARASVAPPAAGAAVDGQREVARERPRAHAEVVGDRRGRRAPGRRSRCEPTASTVTTSPGTTPAGRREEPRREPRRPRRSRRAESSSGSAACAGAGGQPDGQQRREHAGAQRGRSLSAASPRPPGARG